MFTQPATDTKVSCFFSSQDLAARHAKAMPGIFGKCAHNVWRQAVESAMEDTLQQEQIGLALSGGGFRATLFHLGVIQFLSETGRLGAVKRIASVSGGSILAAHLVLHWDEYAGSKEAFDKAAKDLIQFTRDDVRGQIMRRWFFAWIYLFPRFLWRWTATNLLKRCYQRLFKNATLKDLRGSGRPEVAFNCTSLSTGSPCFFSSAGFFWLDGEEEKFVATDEAAVAFAVAASSAFPPLFAPIEISNGTLLTSKDQFRVTQYLTDGGVYDNLGIDRLIKLNRRASVDLDILLVSDAEVGLDAEFETSYTFPIGRNVRASELLMKRVSSLEVDKLSAQKTLFMRVSIKGEASHSNLTAEKQRLLSKVRTDLDAFTPNEVIALIAHGFCKARTEFIKHGLLKDSAPLFSWDPFGNLDKLQSASLTDELRGSSRRKWGVWSYRDWWPNALSVLMLFALLYGASASLYFWGKQNGLSYIKNFNIEIGTSYSNVDADNHIGSKDGTHIRNVTFHNGTNETIDMFWIAEDGTEVLYSTITPGRTDTYPTFVAHHWIAKTPAKKVLLNWVVPR